MVAVAAGELAAASPSRPMTSMFFSLFVPALSKLVHASSRRCPDTSKAMAIHAAACMRLVCAAHRTRKSGTAGGSLQRCRKGSWEATASKFAQLWSSTRGLCPAVRLLLWVHSSADASALWSMMIKSALLIHSPADSSCLPEQLPLTD